MKSYKAKYEILKVCKTPVIFKTDYNYKTTTTDNIKEKMQHEFLQQPYTSDYFDCDDYAWILKALVNKDGVNGIGVVLGRYKDTHHYWNVYLTDNGAMQADPMLSTTFKKSSKYRPYCVLL